MRVALIQVSSQEEGHLDTDTQRREEHVRTQRQTDTRGRVVMEAETGVMYYKAHQDCWQHQKLGRGREGFSSAGFRERVALMTP